jgi:hypothetical protein
MGHFLLDSHTEPCPPRFQAAPATVLTRLERMTPTVSAFSFALGSLAFCVVFLQSRSLPRWLPMLVFEVVLALRLLMKGGAAVAPA